MSFVLDALRKADREREIAQDFNAPLEANDLLNSEIDLQDDKLGLKYLYFLCICFSVFLLSAWIYLELRTDKSVSNKPVVYDKVELVKVDSSTVISNPVEAEIEVAQTIESLDEPDYNITGHIFLSDQHPANKIFVDEFSYRLGGQLPNGHTIINITPRKLVIEKKGKYYEIEY